MNKAVKILIVDDRPDNLLSIETILEKENYHIVKASSGRAALKALLQDIDFSLILMDVQMPDMNGFETAALIYQREKLKNIPIIFITAHSHEEEAIYKGYNVGAVDFIHKPLNPQLLKIKVGLFVELYQKTHSLLEQEKSLLQANALLQKEIEEREASEIKVLELNRQLYRSNVHLKKVNEELDRFAYVASHDLQEPLRKIRVFTDLISNKSNGTPQELDRYISKIGEAAQRMQQLVDDLLRFSRHSTQGRDYVNADLNEIVKEAVSELEIAIQNNQVSIQVDPLPCIPVIPTMIRQVFNNLISNAIKFRKKNVMPVVHIYARKTKDVETPGMYQIFVADNGIGIDNRYLEDIFAVFKRLHSYQEIEGTGIGLSICKKIMEHHNGTITATSEVDHGTTFIIGIPEKQS
ncbi:sensor histidine kinase [Chitinophaga barathri]|uniref:histidine kinase n=1 Tax=Chitinophaga barathri TaxID=1647451 RepID=A0A3N4M5R5_9BACT|nr:response regulator [Chitinophaga barathri]RPD38612.1 hybrid sensor histidine kinase/response regulator [Chitinophaga barathri]